MGRVVLCIALMLGIVACDSGDPGWARLPEPFTVPAGSHVVGVPTPLTGYIGSVPQGAAARFASGWFALLRPTGGPSAAYRSLRSSARRVGVALPAVATACRRPSDPTGAGRVQPMLCDGAATSSDQRTYVAVQTTGRWLGVTYRSTESQLPAPRRRPSAVSETVDATVGTRLLARVLDPNCGEGELEYRAVLVEPAGYWRRIVASASGNEVQTLRTRFEGRTVRILQTFAFGDDATYALTTGSDLDHPVVLIGHCG
jgi:hypothetical protein